MRVSISNIAWDVRDDEAVAECLRAHGVDAIDIAPGKYFPDIENASDGEMLEVRRWWEARGVEIVGMQSLLFGTTGLNLFGDLEGRRAMLDRLEAVCRIGRGVGARKLVFGSPKNRDRGQLSDHQAAEIATDFFRELGVRAERNGVTICLEPNPPRYGANFMTTMAETAAVAERVAHPAISIQLDTGALAINGEDPAEMITRFGALVGHVHASEPDLVTLGDGGVAHDVISACLRQHLPRHFVTIEMLPSNTEPNLQAIDRALAEACRYYGPPA